MALKIGKGASAPPFLVMDVIAAANARQAVLPAGAPQVIRMEVGQPGTGAPVGAVAAVQAALQSGHPLGTPRRSACDPCVSGSLSMRANGMGWTSRLSG